MRPIRLLLAAVTVALVLTGCGFDEPPPPPGLAAEPAPVPSDADIDDPCAAYAVALLDGLLNPLPEVDEATMLKAIAVTEQFQTRYDEVIAAQGVEAARAEYTDDILAACAG
jgi:hypothetical protein